MNTGLEDIKLSYFDLLFLTIGIVVVILVYESRFS
jgi:hypothetical protein